MKTQVFTTLVGAAAFFVSTAEAQKVPLLATKIPVGDTTIFKSKPDCNSKDNLAVYLGQETYYAQHPYDGSGTTPAYGEWNVPCDPAKPNKLTGQPFPADYITCSPNHLVHTLKNGWFTKKNGRGQDRFFTCVQKDKVCPPKIGGDEKSGAEALDPYEPVQKDVGLEELIAHFQSRIVFSEESTDEDKSESYQAIAGYLTQLAQEYEEAEVEGQSDAPRLFNQNPDFQNEQAQWDNWFYSAARQAFQQSCGTRWFAFSGSDDITDWVADFSPNPVDLFDTTFHGGFVGKYNVHNYIDTNFWAPGEHHIFAGHSLGGGITQIAATHLAYKHPQESLEYITHGTGAAVYHHSLKPKNLASPWQNIPATNYVNQHRGCLLRSSFTHSDLVPSLTGLFGVPILFHKELSGFVNDNFEKIGWTGFCNPKKDVKFYAKSALLHSGVNPLIHLGQVYLERVHELGL